MYCYCNFRKPAIYISIWKSSSRGK